MRFVKRVTSTLSSMTSKRKVRALNRKTRDNGSLSPSSTFSSYDSKDFANLKIGKTLIQEDRNYSEVSI